jgi:type III secretory pathway component EscS
MVYCGLGITVILITFLAKLVPEGRTNAAIELGIGMVFIIIFTVLIYRGGWLASAMLVFSNSWRAFTYFNDGRGVHIEILGQRVTQTQPQPLAFINAALMAVIVVFLARSAWFGMRKWSTKRREQTV